MALQKKPTKMVVIILALSVAWLFEKYDIAKYLPRQSEASPLTQAIAQQQSDVQVQSSGTIVKVLPDDNKGSRHQRLLVKLANEHVILIAHNIDLAPRVPSPKEGQTIEFYGEFEWNDRGGVVHWTHHV
ncbi:MAG: DUF3465 domain-containing protein [Gammaproteobacteria bacterium]|nr:DUF3465 domain-containing protein [Gammaproteobacteria bacterium]